MILLLIPKLYSHFQNYKKVGNWLVHVFIQLDTFYMAQMEISRL